MSKSTTLTFGGLSIAVSADERPPLDWLEHFLRPWFGNDADVERGASVELTIDPMLFAQTTSRRPTKATSADCFVLDAGLVSLPVVHRDESRTLFHDEALGAVYEVRPPASIRVIVPADSPGSRVAFMRVVRELVMIDSRASGITVLHASGVAITGSTVAFVGPRRSGKTSMLIHTLLTSDAAFLANDRLVVDDSGSGLDAHGLPTILALRGNTVDRFSVLATRLRNLPARHWLTPQEWASADSRPRSAPGTPIDLTPNALCAALGVEVVPVSPLRAAVFPRLDEAVDVRSCRRLGQDEALAQLRSGIVGAELSRRHADALWPARAVAVNASAEAEEQLRVIARLPCFELRLGGRAYDEPSLPGEILEHVA